MKTLLLSLVAAMVFGTCLAGQSQAQIDTYRAKIPFDFVIGKTHFNAGNYWVEIRGFETKIFVIREVNGRNAYSFLASRSLDGLKKRATELEFQRYGGNYALLNIRTFELAAAVPLPKIQPQSAADRNNTTKTTVSLLKAY